jgi:hypothetical protein
MQNFLEFIFYLNINTVLRIMKISKLLFIFFFHTISKKIIYWTNFAKIMPGCNIKNIHDDTNDQLVDYED